MKLLKRTHVGFERRWCYGYHQGPDALEFHVCREVREYSICIMRRFTVWGEPTYGLRLFGYAHTLRKAEALIARVVGQIIEALVVRS